MSKLSQGIYKRTKCEQCNESFMQHVNNKRQRGVCSEECRKARNRAYWDRIEAERASPSEGAGK